MNTKSTFERNYIRKFMEEFNKKSLDHDIVIYIKNINSLIHVVIMRDGIKMPCNTACQPI